MTGAAGDGHSCGWSGGRGVAWLLDVVAMGTLEPRGAHWPEQTVGAAGPAVSPGLIRYLRDRLANPELGT